MSIIQTLNDATLEPTMTPQHKEKLAALLEYQDKIHAAFGLEFINEMDRLQDELDNMTLNDAYRRGFTDCFQLWLEIFSKYSS